MMPTAHKQYYAPKTGQCYTYPACAPLRPHEAVGVVKRKARNTEKKKIIHQDHTESVYPKDICDLALEKYKVMSYTLGVFLGIPFLFLSRLWLLSNRL